MKTKTAIVSALVTLALGSFSVQNEIMASEGGENTASSFKADTDSGRRSQGGSFALEVRNVTAREKSAGGAFRLIGSTQLKAAGDELFSDGFETGDPVLWSAVVPPVDLPRGAVAFFALEECPAGWDDYYGWYVGRAVVGLMPGGQLLGQVRSQTNGQSGFHYHNIDYSPSTDSAVHNHDWSVLTNEPNPMWRTHDSSGAWGVTLIEWSNGIDGEGSGHYLFAASAGQTFYTANDAHDHSVAYSSSIGQGYSDAIPNVQLLACERQ